MTDQIGSTPPSPHVARRFCRERTHPFGRSRSERQLAEQGFTLVELMVSMTILLIVLTLTTTIINSFFSSQTRITATYNGFDQILPATTTMQRFAITMVEATPPALVDQVYVPTPPYLLDPTTNSYELSPNSATFTSNVGDPNGPSLITISTTTNAPPRSGSPQTYTVKATITPADAGHCPDVSAGTACIWNGPAKEIFTLTDVINGSVTSPTPLFQYTTALSGGTPVPYSNGTGTPSTSWTTAFGPGSCIAQGNCPADQITSIAINFQVQPRGSSASVYQTTVTPVSIPYAQNVG